MVAILSLSPDALAGLDPTFATLPAVLMPVGSAILLTFTLAGSSPLGRVRDGDSLLLRLSSRYLGLDVLAERRLAGRFDERHGQRLFFAGVVRSRTVVRMMSGLLRVVINTSSASGARRSLPGVTGGAMPTLGLGGLGGSSLIVTFLPRTGLNPEGFIAIYLPFLAVLALSRNAFAVGAPLVPGLRIFSPDPAAIRAFLA